MSLLCRVADVSRKSYYYHLKHPFSVADAEITGVIRRLQTDHKGSIGYRPMTRLVSQECGKKVNRKRVRRLMKENDLLSAVRRRKWSDEVYAKRRELKAVSRRT